MAPLPGHCKENNTRVLFCQTPNGPKQCQELELEHSNISHAGLASSNDLSEDLRSISLKSPMPSRMFVDGDVEFWFFRLRPRNVQFAGMECQFVDGPSCYCQASVWISVRKCGTLGFTI